MKKILIILPLLFVITTVIVKGQDTVCKTKYLSIGSKSAGLCIGNSLKYNGIRINLWDRQSNNGVINGINTSLSICNKVTNGINLGVIATDTRKTNGIQISAIASVTDYLNGFTFGGIGVNSVKINGVAIGGIYGVSADTLNGIFWGLTGVGSNNFKGPYTVINGIAMGTILVKAETVRGLTCALYQCSSEQHYGVSIAGYNKTDELHGMQLGLLNYAGNNPRLFKWMPVFNFHL